MQKRKASADELIALILHGIEEVKGLDINLLDLREIENTVCDYFIICNGTSNTHVNAIVNSIQKSVSKETKDKPWHIEADEISYDDGMEQYLAKGNVTISKEDTRLTADFIRFDHKGMTAVAIGNVMMTVGGDIIIGNSMYHHWGAGCSGPVGWLFQLSKKS